MRIAERAGTKKAAVALARKLAVIMHRMLADGTPFTTQPA
jgi:transposase